MFLMSIVQNNKKTSDDGFSAPGMRPCSLCHHVRRFIDRCLPPRLGIIFLIPMMPNPIRCGQNPAPALHLDGREMVVVFYLDLTEKIKAPRNADSDVSWMEPRSYVFMVAGSSYASTSL